MTRIQKRIGTSVFSLLLLTVTLFSMCSVRMQKLDTDGDIDDLALFDEPIEESGSEDDLLNKLEVLDGDATAEDDLASLLQESSEGDLADANPDLTAGDTSGDDFLTPELISSLESEIDDLQKIYNAKERVADSLRQENVSSQVAAIEPSVNASPNFFNTPAPTTSSFDRTPAATADYMSTEAGRAYRDALDLYYARQFAGAISGFRSLLISGAAGDLADNCQYWIGESYYAQGKFVQALVEFEKVNRFPGANKTTDAQLMAGLSLMKNGDNAQARSELMSLLNFHRNQSAAKKAQHYLSSLSGV